MSKSPKRTYRELHYSKMADGYQLLKSPVAASYRAAAEHYKKIDPPIDPPSNNDARVAEKSGGAPG